MEVARTLGDRLQATDTQRGRWEYLQRSWPFALSFPLPMGDAQCMFSLSFMGATHLKTGFSWYFIFANYSIQTMPHSQTSHLSEATCVTEAEECFLDGSCQAFSLGRAVLMGNWGLAA